jgi:glycosyltransferase involved in cell wall biosynthesis
MHCRMISVLIPTSDRPEYLRDAISSVLRQSRTDLIGEFIVSDNGLTESRKVVEEFSNFKITYIKQAKRLGPGEHFRVLAEMAKHDWIAMLADDDIWGRYHLEEADRLLSKYPEALAVFNQTVAVSNASRQLLGGYGQLCHVFSSRLIDHLDDGYVFKRGELLVDSLIKTPLNMWSMVIKRPTLLNHIGIFSEDISGIDSDRFFVWRLNTEGVVIAGREIGLFMRCHPQMAGVTMRKDNDSKYSEITKHYSRRIVAEASALGLPVRDKWEAFWKELLPEDHQSFLQQANYGLPGCVDYVSELLGSDAATSRVAPLATRPSNKQRIRNTFSKFFQDFFPPVIYRRLVNLKKIIRQQIYK